ncbi:MAG TPA: aldehyde dehydrogenase family protein [Thermoanaerobaculia bacterium]|nr:aldehyde dehydrogenase family protein [Thermoanaerobaculia bacterium]
MSAHSPDQIRRLAEIIAREMVAERAQDSSGTGTSPGGGVFESLDDAVAASSAAWRALDVLGLSKRHELIESMREAMRQNARALAALAVEETGLGRVEDKIQKNLLVTNKTPGPEELTPVATSGDHGLALIEPAPFGVIGAITPVTNPSSTIICNSIGMVAAGNTVVFNPHPSAKRVSAETVRLLGGAVVKAGGPPNAIACTADPTIQSAGELMKHPRVRLLVVTGGGAVVAAAMNSGKRAICAGPGNPPAIVDQTADIEKAGRDVVFGHSFDNNVICTDEKEVIAVDSIADALKGAMKRAGAFELPAADLPRLEKVIFEKGAGPRGHAVVNKKYIGKDASVILRELGITAGPEVRTVLVEVPNEHPLIWTEQMMPVLPLTRVKNVDEAIDLAVAAEQAYFHTATMHSHDIAALSAMARRCNCSIFVKNGPNLAGLGFGGEGYTSFTISSPTGEGMTSPRSFSRWRRCTLVDHFRIV